MTNTPSQPGSLVERLKPCPWCEGTDIGFVRQSNVHGKMYCDDCGAYGPVAESRGDGDDERAPAAIAAWNTRASSDASRIAELEREVAYPSALKPFETDEIEGLQEKWPRIVQTVMKAERDREAAEARVAELERENETLRIVATQEGARHVFAEAALLALREKYEGASQSQPGYDDSASRDASAEAESSAAWRADLARGVRLIAKDASGTVSLQGNLLDFTALLEIAARELEPPK